MKVITGMLASAVLAFGGSALCLGSTAGASTGSKLAPVGAKQPKAGASVSACDSAAVVLADTSEGACTLDGDTVVTANKNHAVALKALTVDVVDVKQITTIKIGSGSIHPLVTDVWIAIKVQVKNTSGKSVQMRDEQFSLLLGATSYSDQPEATSSESDSLTKLKPKLGNGKVRSGTIVFAVPVDDAGMVTTAPSAFRFAAFGGDFAFNQLPGKVFGLIRLSH